MTWRYPDWRHTDVDAGVERQHDRALSRKEAADDADAAEQEWRQLREDARDRADAERRAA